MTPRGPRGPQIHAAVLSVCPSPHRCSVTFLAPGHGHRSPCGCPLPSPPCRQSPAAPLQRPSLPAGWAAAGGSSRHQGAREPPVDTVVGNPGGQLLTGRAAGTRKPEPAAKAEPGPDGRGRRRGQGAPPPAMDAGEGTGPRARRAPPARAPGVPAAGCGAEGLGGRGATGLVLEAPSAGPLPGPALGHPRPTLGEPEVWRLRPCPRQLRGRPCGRAARGALGAGREPLRLHLTPQGGQRAEQWQFGGSFPLPSLSPCHSGDDHVRPSGQAEVPRAGATLARGRAPTDLEATRGGWGGGAEPERREARQDRGKVLSGSPDGPPPAPLHRARKAGLGGKRDPSRLTSPAPLPPFLPRESQAG